jgi:diadenosine tetraphosphate (Ap4A) HIT family hydrolase
MRAMQSGPPVRSRKNEKQYSHYTRHKADGCDFCAFTVESQQVIKEYPQFWVITNMFAYEIWDGLNVLEHLMVVPKRHVDSISHFNDAESKEYLSILGEYESAGYSIYARAAQNIAKSVQHQHTHLIKMGNKKARALLYVHKPHYLKYF